MDITKYMHMKNRHCSHILLGRGSCIAPWGHGGSITFKLYKLLVLYIPSLDRSLRQRKAGILYQEELLKCAIMFVLITVNYEFAVL